MNSQTPPVPESSSSEFLSSTLLHRAVPLPQPWHQSRRGNKPFPWGQVWDNNQKQPHSAKMKNTSPRANAEMKNWALESFFLTVFWLFHHITWIPLIFSVFVDTFRADNCFHTVFYRKCDHIVNLSNQTLLKVKRIPKRIKIQTYIYIYEIFTWQTDFILLVGFARFLYKNYFQK